MLARIRSSSKQKQKRVLRTSWTTDSLVRILIKMGRRRRNSDSDGDDLEGYFERKRQKSEEAQRNAVSGISEEERQRRKAAKKARQKEKKLAERKQQELKAQEAKLAKAAEQERLEKKRQRKREKRERDRLKKAVNPGEEAAPSKSSEPIGEVKDLPMGIKYYDKQVGSGPSLEDRSRIRVSYVGRANDESGKVFDRSNDFSFKIGKGEVIKGWDIGMRSMKKGGTRVLIVPPKAGYGNRDVGAGVGGKLWFQVHVKDDNPNQQKR